MSDNNVSDAAYAVFVEGLFQGSKDDPAKTFTHAVLGIATEIHELLDAGDRVNVVEELGDLQFYVAALGNFAREHLPKVTPEQVGKIVAQVAQDVYVLALDDVPAEDLAREQANELLDLAKRWVGYGKTPDPAAVAEHASRAAVAAYAIYADAYNVDVEEAKRANVAKLQARYPGGWDASKAINRDLEAERAVLEAAALG